MRICPKTEQRILNWYIPIGLLILNFIIKIFYLNINDIVDDEPFTIFHAQMDISTIIMELSKGNNPPLFEIILHYWIKLFGISEFSVRFLPFLFSVTTVYFIYKIGLTFFNSRIAILSSLLFTFSTYSAFFSHETRVYPLLTLLTVISMFAFLHLIKNNKNKLYITILIISNVLLGYAHYFGFFVMITQMLCCLAFKDIRKPMLKLYLISTVILILLYLPNLPIFLRQFISSSIKGTWVSPVGFDNLFFLFKLLCNSLIAVHLFILICLTALIKRFFGRFETLPAYNKVIFTWFLFPFLFMFLISYKHFFYPIPMFIDRYIIFLSPGFYLSISICIYEIFRKVKFGDIFMSIPILLTIFYFKPYICNYRDINGATTKVKELQTTETLVYICPAWFDLNFVYYYDINIFKLADHEKVRELLAQKQIFPFNYSFEIDMPKLLQAEQVIYFDARADIGCQGNNIIPTIEELGFYLADSTEYKGETKIRLFKKTL